MKQFILVSFIVLTTLLHTDNTFAETGYVSDILYVPLRSGKGNQFRILDSAMKSGTKLEILAEDTENGWFTVRTNDGKEGYVRAQYIIKEPTAQLKLTNAEQQISSLKQRTQQLQSELDQLQQNNKDLNSQLNSSIDAKSETTRELEEIKRVSSDAIELNHRHQDLLNQHQMLQNQVDILKAENSRYKNDNRQTWFIYGAAAVFLGAFIAIIIPRFNFKKKNSEWIEYK